MSANQPVLPDVATLKNRGASRAVRSGLQRSLTYTSTSSKSKRRQIEETLGKMKNLSVSEVSSFSTDSLETIVKL